MAARPCPARVGLEAEPGARLASLSGGQRTRAGMVLVDPDFLLLDESTNNLDREGRAVVLALLASWLGTRSSSATTANCWRRWTGSSR